MAVILCLMAPTFARAQEAAQQSDLTALFDAGWDATSAASRTAADQAFQSLARQGRSDAQTHYAYALVLMKQRRYDEALKAVDASLKLEETNLAARQNKVRVLVLTKSYPAAVVELERIGQQLAEPSLAQKPPKQVEEVVRFLGRMIGFLEGPAGKDAASANLRRVQRELEKQLSEQHFAIYEEARDGVLTRFEELTGQTQQGREEALAEGEKKRDEAKQDLEIRRTEQQMRRTELLMQAEKLRAEIRDNEAALAKEERPLLDQIARLDRQAEIPRREIAILVTEADRLRFIANRTEDPFERDRLRFRAQQMDIAAARYDSDLAILEREASVVNAERARLQERFARQNATLVGTLRGIDAELQELQKGEKRIAMDEKRVNRPLTSGTRAIRALEAEANAFTTYEPLPLEEDRQRLLEAF
jgi:hypothetical protein